MKYKTFDQYKNQEWRSYHPDMNDQIIPCQGDLFLLINRKTGEVYTKIYEETSISERYHVAGYDMCIAFCKEKECFN